ncbi:hypothetical protein E8E11_003398 [Didymella keratinophila]|nr:hypothetical protein E8E11_003398 [Didymella keratinophila]
MAYGRRPALQYRNECGGTTQATITDRERTNRITTLLNTYFQGCAWGYQVTRSGFFDIPEYPWAGLQNSRSPDRWISASDAAFSHPVPIYRADVGWIVSLLLTTLVLLLLGIVNAAYSFVTIAPDLFYYASSLARENPYTNTPNGGTTMDGAERSRLLRDLKIQIADVSPEHQVGYIVVKSVEGDEDFLTGRLKKVDMAVPYDDRPDQDSEFASMRDSFYILMNLKQYKMKSVISMTWEAESLLRIALFSKELKLIGTHKTLSQKRLKLAHDLRSNRRKGVVPIFLSTLWFIVALGISLEAAFGNLGSNLQARNLAMNLFVSWLPILILCSILDRNPVASDDIQRKLNKLVDLVCDSLLDPRIRSEYVASFAGLSQEQHVVYWVSKIAARADLIKSNYFQGFAGQARTRFHYGAAYAILVDIEKVYIAERGRYWLSNPKEARAALVLDQLD